LKKIAAKGLYCCDEFTSCLDVGIGKKAIELLERLGYAVIAMPIHKESGRTYLSEGNGYTGKINCQ
jgi:Fe-S oxidoreductase